MNQTPTQFSAADLEPSDEERRLARRALVERIAATVAIVAAGSWVGGLVALGACAAPFVFRMTPAPFSGDAMAAAFGRFDQIAIGSAVVLLGAEVARTWAAGRRGRALLSRLRRFAAMSMAALAVYTGLSLTPRIASLHHEGVRRGVGEEGAMLEHIHARAELTGKATALLGIAVIALHVFTLRGRHEDDDEHEADAPLPPGPPST
jgi:hypothetical protein